MKYLIYTLLLLSLGCSTKQKDKPLVLDPTWKKKTISDVLSVSLPDSADSNKKGVLRSSFAEGKTGFYEVDYYDTVAVDITSESDFRKAMKGFMQEQLKHPDLLSYDMLVRDTSIGGMSGIFLSGNSNDSLLNCKYAFCYFTLANNKFYWFVACQDTPGINDGTRQFYHAIQFEADKIRESGYTVSPVGIHKIKANFR